MSTPSAASSVPLPEGVALETVHGVDALVVDTPAARAVVHLDGAHLTSWVPTGEADLLWLSPDSAYGPREAIRGGIPLVGPWFGPGRDGAMQVKHGWLRTITWELASAALDGEDVVLELVTPADAVKLSGRAVFRIGRQLSVDLTLTAGPTPLEVEAALHTYLAVGDVRRITVQGLENADYLDNTRGLAADVLGADPLRLTGSTDRIVDAAGEVVVTDEVGGRRLVSSPRGTATTIVWNPWDELVTSMGDIPDDAWPQFVCVEPAVAKDRFVRLQPGQAHTIGVTYRIEH
ncbi:D-hexose-6-phosphate mutarotase [Brachybacterium fresconis]|uniref:Putative glucose-6-phosphate 1-epimerase n=1 Tax=Brachybacterium fresconis TaxID=173363 RepID=A0ABS4YEL0_9MICO|nr:D-hexose-6-phosphate mutarotase [Brachybacterium fresconis]MBP2407179.1 glucose-6-phosphate 1-epimerase [Brachybacterium fresconis]